MRCRRERAGRPGDIEPEDAWDVGDATDALLDNLDRRCTELGEPRLAPADATATERLDDIGRRAGWILTRSLLTDRELERANLIADDVVTVRRLLGEYGDG